MKTIRIIQLIVLLIIVALLTTILIVGSMGSFSLPFGNIFRSANFSNAVLIYDQTYDGSNLKLVDTNLSSANLEYQFSQDSEIRVVYYGPESEKDDPIVKTEYDSSTLRINQKNRINFFNIISGEKVVVYLPADFDKEIIGMTASGNIQFQENVELDKLKLELSSGNISLKDISATDLEVLVSSGRIVTETMNTENYRIKMSSGNFKASEIIGNGNILSTSGNINIDKFKGGGSIESTSGSVNIAIDQLDSDLDIGLTSGSVTVDFIGEDPDISCRFDVLSGRISTDFGTVDKNLTGASFKYDFTDDPAYRLNINTTSGNIRANR